MGYAQSYTADVQAIAIASGDPMSLGARDAEASLRQVHRDLPQMVDLSAKMLKSSGMDVGASKATSHRLTESLLREVASSPSARHSNYERDVMTRDALRSVLIQEAAAHEYESRTGKPDTFRQFMGEHSQINGAKAMETLDRHKVDTVALYGQASDVELKQMSVGAFDRMSTEQQKRTAKALEIEPDRIQDRALSIEMPQPQQARALPVQGIVRRRPQLDNLHRAAPSFGRRMEPAIAMAAASQSR